MRPVDEIFPVATPLLASHASRPFTPGSGETHADHAKGESGAELLTQSSESNRRISDDPRPTLARG